jgi:tetratricopeptide (TPR) repeat protein
MTRHGRMLFALMLLLPTAATAQTRPSNTMHTNSAELYFERARRTTREAEKLELLQKALGFAQDGIKARADNPRAYLLAGKIQVQLGNAAAADSMFDKAEQLWPEYTKETETERMQAWVRAYNAGVVATRANDVAEAIKQFESAAQIHDKRPGAHLNLAQIHARQRQTDKAIAAYRDALAILAKPENRQGLKPEEEAQAKEFEEASTFNLAQLLATAGKNEEAVATYQEYLKRSPNNTLVKSNLAVVLSRMGRTEEAAGIYNELLAQDLSAEDFFNVGVGLFRSTQHEAASNAFRKALARNPQMRDASYNLAQSLYSLASELEGQKAGATGEALKTLQARLTSLFTEIAQVTETLRSIDPANRNVIALQSRAYRSLADLTSDARASADWKNKTLEVLKANEALIFTVEDVTLAKVGEDVQITGNVVNQKGTAGQTVKLRVHFLGSAGAPLGAQEVSVALTDAQGAAPFKVTLKPSQDVLGWKYEVVQ